MQIGHRKLVTVKNFKRIEFNFNALYKNLLLNFKFSTLTKG